MREKWRHVLLLLLLTLCFTSVSAQSNGGNGGGFGDDEQVNPSTGGGDSGGTFGDSDQDNPSTEGSGGGFSDGDMGGGVPLGDDDSPVIVFADEVVKMLCLDNWDCNGDGELSEAEAATITDLYEVFKGNEEITSFEELSYFTGLTSIGALAFDGCISLTVVTIPENVKSIGNEAFLGCFELTSMEIPNGAISIGEGAFKYCNGLTSVTIPESMTSIGNAAFSGCSSLTQVKANMLEPLPISSNTFTNRRNATLIVPVRCGPAYSAADYWKEFNPIIEIIPGDTNADWKVSISDAVAIVNYLMGNTSPDFADDAADVNKDGEITIEDALSIVNIILGDNNSTPASVRMKTQEQ